MSDRRRAPRATFLSALLLAALAGCGGGSGSERPPAARAWQDTGAKVEGEWSLYYAALPTTELEPAMARAYGVLPRPRRALVSVSLLRRGDPEAAGAAEITVAARTLLGQPREVALRRVVVNGVVAWLGEFDVAHREQLVFEVTGRAPGLVAPIRAEFRREFHLLD